MTDLKKIGELVDAELKEANKEHPLFVDNHQAYAVIKEEFEEAHEDLVWIQIQMRAMWEQVRADDSCTNAVGKTKLYAIQLAAEAIQIAAMCQKAMDSEKAREGK